jgi:hypothetical protein
MSFSGNRLKQLTNYTRTGSQVSQVLFPVAQIFVVGLTKDLRERVDGCRHGRFDADQAVADGVLAGDFLNCEFGDPARWPRPVPRAGRGPARTRGYGFPSRAAVGYRW